MATPLISGALHQLDALSKAGIRYQDDNTVTKSDIEALASWTPKAQESIE